MYNDKNFYETEYEDSLIPIPSNASNELSEEYLKTIPDFDDNFTIDMVIQKILKSDRQYDLSKITSAYEFAAKYHAGQKRSSGQDYIIHPLAVTLTVFELGMDTDTLCAALLHDVVEDTPATLDDIKKRFGLDVANLVDGVTKISKVPTHTKAQQQAKNVMKIIIAMGNDPRVMIIKLADRLHNIRTLKYRPYNKQIATADETIRIFAPLAHRLGIRAIKEELEDMSFRYIDPYAYIDIERKMESTKELRESFILNIINILQEKINSTTYFTEPPQISGRIKTPWSIYKKLYMQHKTMDEIYDKYAVRIIVSSFNECYNALGIVNDTFSPIPNRYKDYISHPKSNGYQSLHTTVIGSDGIPFEIQIRTWEMHQNAEYGIAAHWKYKEGIKGKDKIEQHLAWVRQCIEAQQTSDDVEDIVHMIKTDIASEDIVVVTPKGLSIDLPQGSTVIDFAYRIHTEIGHKTTGAKVDGRIVPLDFQLETGQICEIITTKDPEKGPNRAWLNIVKTNEARSKIRSWFKREKREENIIEGKAELARMFKKYRIIIPENELADFLADDMRRHNCETLDDFYASIGYRGTSIDKLMPRLKDKYQKQYEEKIQVEKARISSGIILNDQNCIVLDKIKNLQIKYSQCCNPLPSDDIIGFVTRGYGISVHTKKCSNYKAAVQRNDPEELSRWCNIKWSEGKENSVLQTSFEVLATDRVGLVHDVTEVLLECRVPILHSSSRALKNGNAVFDCTVTIANADQLKHLFDKIKKIKDVISVDRSSI